MEKYVQFVYLFLIKFIESTQYCVFILSYSIA